MHIIHFQIHNKQYLNRLNTLFHSGPVMYLSNIKFSICKHADIICCCPPFVNEDVYFLFCIYSLLIKHKIPPHPCRLYIVLSKNIHIWDCNLEPELNV